MNHAPCEVLNLCVTNRCNLRCFHCSLSAGEAFLEEMDLSEIDKIFQNAAAIGIKKIDLTGGEPMMRNDIFKIIRAAKSLGIKTKLLTNGLLLNKDKLKRLKDAGLNGISFSLDGDNFMKYALVRGIGYKQTFDKLLRNIALSAKLGFYTKINTVVFECNLRNIRQTTELAIDLGADEQRFCYFSPIGRGKKFGGEVPDPVKWLWMVRNHLYPLKTKIRLVLEVPLIEAKIAEKTETRCLLEKPPSFMVAYSNGGVFPCSMMGFANRPIGSLHAESLDSLWQSAIGNCKAYYSRAVLPLLDPDKTCAKIMSRHEHYLSAGKYKTVCPARKYSIEDIMP